LMDRSKIRRTCASRTQIIAWATQVTTIRWQESDWIVTSSYFNYFQCLYLTATHPKTFTDEIQHASQWRHPRRRYAIGLPPNKLASNPWSIECSRSKWAKGNFFRRKWVIGVRECLTLCSTDEH
jgi:hypothetical protein